MSLIGIDRIWHRKITPGDFFNIERSGHAGPDGGGGQLFIDIPTSVREGLFTMLELEAPTDANGDWPAAVVDAKAIGDPSKSGQLRFELNRRNDGRYRIRNQNRQTVGSERHPAWTATMGFPRAPDDVASREAAALHLGEGAHIYIVKSSDEEYFAGFTSGSTIPDSWPRGAGLRELFDTNKIGGLLPRLSVHELHKLPEAVHRVLEAWKRQPNVLLYGPTGTGKTHVMSLLWQLIESSKGLPTLMLDPEDQTRPFRAMDAPVHLPYPVARDWVTFHQNYGYEDFVIGLRPHSGESSGGFVLRPRAGRLLQLAVEVACASFDARSGVLFIDEINRGNAARIFGEFITFMENSYRDTDTDAGHNPSRLPVPLVSLNTKSGETEKIDLPSGGTVRLPVPWFFPKDVYTLASMNSVDRTVAPLDSALARRFERIDMFPDLAILEDILDVSLADAIRKVDEAGEGAPELTPEECAILILRHLNARLATTLGPDFEIGHTYMLPLADAATEEAGFRSLAIIWDQSIMPQLYDRFLTRQDELLSILEADGAIPVGYAFQQRTDPAGSSLSGRPVLDRVSMEALADTDLERVKLTFRYLASNQ